MMGEPVATSPPANGQAQSKYRRFQAIMEAAAGPAQADYGGYGKFWNLPLPALRGFELYGIPMMRAAGDAGTPARPSCCHAAPRAVSSGASQAGLILGLRGQFPFDGTQFPPLPWGGSRVAEPDIQLIESWIAAGCPPEEAPRTSGTTTERHALAAGIATHPEFAGPVNMLAHESGRLRVRKNVNHLTQDELRRLRAAIQQMRKLDAYPLDQRSFAYWAQIHANQCQHGWEEFLTWHRAYLYGFEKQLQDIDPTVTLPYWDWAADAANVKISIEDMSSTAPRDNGYVPAAFQCWIDEDGLRTLTDAGPVGNETLAGLRNILDKPFGSGARLFTAAGVAFGRDPASDGAIINVLADINPLWHWNRWPGGSKDLIFEAYPTPQDVDRVLELTNFFTFGSGPLNHQYFGTLETIHNLIHNYSGGASPYPVGPNNDFTTGDMVDPGRTARDPIFWAHHSNVDRLWAEWQRRNPDVGPDNPDANLPPWSFDVSDMKDTRSLGYEYMAAAHVFPTDSQTPIHRFVSAPAAVHPDVLAGHRRAEIKLRGIRYATRPGFFIRVFLNQPDATIATPTRGNPHFVAQVSTFMGECVGGPGHCDAPAARRDPFDRRPRPQKTPTNFFIDATAAIKALGPQAAQPQVNLVVFNLDGSPATDALHLDAVSLDFFD